jgi:hypothetical protein
MNPVCANHLHTLFYRRFRHLTSPVLERVRRAF